MTSDERRRGPYPLSNGSHYFLVAEPSFIDRELGVHMTEFGPFSTGAQAADALPLYELMLREDLSAHEVDGATFRVIEVEVGDALAPTSGGEVMVARTAYLERPVAGGFSSMAHAMWVYGVVMDHVEARFAYLGETLFETLDVHVDEDWIFAPDETVWIRMAAVEVIRPRAEAHSPQEVLRRLIRHDDRPGSELSLLLLRDAVPATRMQDGL